ncbi:ABC transporter transmembrane domain-containing protein [Halosimplex carlsbadense]|uniref:ABC transporter transmembrane domain-containing protein n=1 Tax=Halosimplex carlsbadense TaxID=171164 RepID=UPI001EFF2609|nr:ABC transporter transmembrane domain-containing protein [Halosimplex carlsbadense]
MTSKQDTKKEITFRDKVEALYQVAKFRPKFAVAVIVLSTLAAMLEGFGLSFILPIIDVAQSGGAEPKDASGVLQVFLRVYDILNLPFTIEYLVTGVIGIMTIRFTASFLVGWFRAAIETQYVRYLQTEVFDRALDARISYFDNQGSDAILNTIVTQSEYAGQVIRFAIQTIEQAMLSLVYVSIALYLAPQLTLAVGGFLTVVFYFFSDYLESGYSLGDQVATAKEEIQEFAQAGTQGIRDVKLFGVSSELRRKFKGSVESFETNRIILRRNEEAIKNFYQLATAVGVFVLLYGALTFSSLSFGALGIFLFAMFRLGPKLSALNNNFYRTQGELPHLVKTQAFIDTIKIIESKKSR